ncbi:MAG: transposase [Candidatus Micrarchaeota archaeon]|nr:transposase [Nitrososphaerota archaeon]MDE1860078.1 transposase [Candidatus Micrarchaeota archaeon]
MKISELENKIPEVSAAARVIAQAYGHTKKFAKHLVALVVKQIEDLTDLELVEFVGTKIGKLIGYNVKPTYSIFSQVRKRADPAMFEEMNNWILSDKLKGMQIRLLAQDSTDIPAFSRKDKDARKGHRTPSKREQEDADGHANEMFFGYKLHMICDAETEIPIAFYIAPGNRHDKIFFGKLIGDVRNRFRLRFDAKYLADSAYDSTDVREYLHYHRIKDAIAINGRTHRKSETPKDPDYGKRWAIERIFSRMKEVFGLEKNRVIGLKKVLIHAYSCITAYLIAYLM